MWLVVLTGGYLLGSIPFGLILTRLARVGDICQISSGNIGATNVLRTGSKKLALATLLLDSGKGAAAVLITGVLFNRELAILAGACALIGHVFPLWLGFHGGKGVATALGVLLAISWPIGVLSCLTWVLVALSFRWSSLAALVTVAAAPIYVGIIAISSHVFGLTSFAADFQLMSFALFVAILVVWRHTGNIQRLLKGTEPKININKS
jgi:glycerol-3-phosphate acyltransferase PlsY